MAVLPMFPLGTVLLPGGVLPLHVFEPRYRQLVIDCLNDDSGDPEFGVTLIERGSEVGGGDQRSAVGVVGRMVQVDALPGGRYAVVAVGTRRFRVNAWLPDDPYPLADVDEWRDVDPDAPELPDRVAGGDHEAARGPRPGGSPRRGAERSADQRRTRSSLRTTCPASRRSGRPIATGCCARPHPPERLDLLAEALDDVEAMLRFRLA